MGQCNNLYAMAGAAPQLQGIFCRMLVGVSNPFKESQADRPVPFKPQLSAPSDPA